MGPFAALEEKKFPLKFLEIKIVLFIKIGQLRRQPENIMPLAMAITVAATRKRKRRLLKKGKWGMKQKVD